MYDRFIFDCSLTTYRRSFYLVRLLSFSFRIILWKEGKQWWPHQIKRRCMSLTRGSDVNKSYKFNLTDRFANPCTCHLVWGVSLQMTSNLFIYSDLISLYKRRSRDQTWSYTAAQKFPGVQAAYENMSTVAHKTWLISNDWMTIMLHGYALLKITYLDIFSIKVCFCKLMLRITNDQSNHRH